MRRCPVPLGGQKVLEAGGPTLIAGVLNVTPDSFSDGGALPNVEAAVAQARRLVAEGADWLDIGGESTRPNAAPVTVEEELRRVIPVLRALRERVGVPLSIDTRRAPVFVEAAAAGASILNDVSGLRDDPALAPAAAATDVAVVLMHSRGDPRTMDQLARYDDVVAEVQEGLAAAVARAEGVGIARDRLLLDPGLGFAKTSEQNWCLLRSLGRLRSLGLPLFVGPSRKRFLGALTGREAPTERDTATAALCAHLALEGVEVVRVHAVAPTRDAILVLEAARGGVA